MAVVNGNRVTHVEHVGRTTTGDPGEIGPPFARSVIDKRGTMARFGRRGGKIVNSFVRHNHNGRHPGFSKNTFPARGAKMSHVRGGSSRKATRSHTKRY